MIINKLLRLTNLYQSNKPVEPILSQPLTFIAVEKNISVGLYKKNSPDPVNIFYKINDSNWTRYTLDTDITLPNIGDRLMFKNTLTTFSKAEYQSYHFQVKNGLADIEGNCNSLINFSNTLSEWVFVNLFRFASDGLDTNNIRHAKNLLLPASNLTKYCYKNMFVCCQKLISAPALPSLNLNSYCYDSMFYNCNKLTNAPELPATILFSNSYLNMFYGCNKLSLIKVYFTNWGSNTNSWVSSVSTNGTFYKPAALPKTFGTSRIPNNWTVIDI